MCNAWNHRPGCICGWGGFGFHSSNSVFLVSPPKLGTWESYVNPSAACPVCGAPVFFYQSRSGGRVFFDELGPPWPKHPCTDNGREPVPRVSTKTRVSAAPDWVKVGWSPLLNVSATDLTPDLIRLEAKLGGSTLSVYVPKAHLRNCLDPARELQSAPVHGRPAEQGTYELELLGPSAQAISMLGYLSMAEALAEAERRRPAKRQIHLILKKPKA